MPNDDKQEIPSSLRHTKFHRWKGFDTEAEEKRAQFRRQALPLLLRRFAEHKVEHPPRTLSAETPVPLDLCPLSEAGRLARVSVYTIYRLIKQGLLRRWGTAGMYRVSISELMPETSRRTDRVMQCAVCGRKRVGRPGLITGWKSLQLSVYGEMYVCTDHFPQQYVEESKHSVTRNAQLQRYQEEVLLCWGDVLATLIRRLADEDSGDKEEA